MIAKPEGDIYSDLSVIWNVNTDIHLKAPPQPHCREKKKKKKACCNSRTIKTQSREDLVMVK